MHLLHKAGAFVRLCVLSALSMPLVLAAQTTTITASQQQWGGTWLTQGTVSLIPVTPDGNPQPFSANGKFYPPASRQNFNSGFLATVVKGALSANIVVPDKSAATSSYPLCYDVQLRNDNTGQVADIGVRCDITGTAVSLDNYVPPVVAPGYVVGYTHGVLAALPAHCAAGAQYGADDTYAVYFCGLDSKFHAPAGGGSGATPTITIGTVTQGTAAATLTGSGGAYTLNLTLPQGATGTAGTNGTTPSFTIGTVATGAAGSQATVTLTGTTTAPILNFSIPQGATGSGGSGSSIALKVNGTANGSQTVLNLKAGSAVALSDDGSGGITVALATNVANGVAGLDATASISPLQDPALGKNVINVQAAPYYASPDGSTTTVTSAAVGANASSVPVASCSTFAAHQGVLIAGAAASGANYIGTVSGCSGSTLTVSPATSTAVASSTAVWHDETAAYQSAITALASTGGTILVPMGVYLVNGPLQDTGGANAILDLPSATSNVAGQPPLLIEFRGARRTSQGNNYQATTILTNAQSGALIGGYNSGGSIPGFTNYHVSFSNLNFNVQAANDTSNLRMIDARHFMGLQLDHVWVGGGGDKNATGSSVGVAFPLILNNVENVVGDSWVTGFATNWIFTEHTHVREAYSLFSPNCFQFDNGAQSVFSGYTGNTVQVDYIWSQTCGKGITSGGGSTVTPVHISTADIESTDTMVSDPGGNLHGYLGLLQPYAPYTMTVSGGSNLAIFDIAHGSFLHLGATVLTGGNVNSTSTFTPAVSGNVFNMTQAATLDAGLLGQLIVVVNATGSTLNLTPTGSATINSSTAAWGMAPYKRQLFVVNPTAALDWLAIN